MFPCSKASHALRGRAATCVLGIGDESLRLLPCGELRVAEGVPDGRRTVRVIMKVRYAQYTTRTPGRVLTAPSSGVETIDQAALAALDASLRRPVRLLGVRAELEV